MGRRGRLGCGRVKSSRGKGSRLAASCGSGKVLTGGGRREGQCCLLRMERSRGERGGLCLVVGGGERVMGRRRRLCNAFFHWGGRKGELFGGGVAQGRTGKRSWLGTSMGSREVLDRG